MLFALPMPSEQARVKVAHRVAAKGIDFVFWAVLVAIPYAQPLGPLLGFFYSLFADGLNVGRFRGQSIGKKILKLQVVRIPGGESCRFRQSALRNAPIAVATFFAVIPIAGWIILVLLGIPLMVMEIYLMSTVSSGHRLGDVMGDTEVVDAKHR